MKVKTKPVGIVEEPQEVSKSQERENAKPGLRGRPLRYLPFYLEPSDGWLSGHEAGKG